MKRTGHQGIDIIRSAARALFVVAGRSVASATIVRGTWLLRVPGHLWPVTEDMGDRSVQ